MRPLLVPVLAVFLVAVLGGTEAAPADTTTRSLERALEARLQRANLKAHRYGIVVFTREARPQIVLARGHTRPLIPASTAKVLTAAAALDLLGPCHVFTTSLSARGTLRADGVLEGDLVVHGTGDPNLSGRFHDGKPTHVLEGFARALKKAGIRRVTGALVLDDGPFDREVFHPTWSTADRGRWYGAPVAGLAFNDSCADIVVTGASRPGSKASIASPSTVGDWRLENRVRTVAKGRPAVGGMWVSRGNVLRVQGSIAKGCSYPFSHPVRDPLRFFGGALLKVLDRQGVSIDGGARVAENDRDRAVGRKIAQFGSRLGPTLEVMNRRSQNFYASMVFKASGATLGGRGSWESGEEAVRHALRRRGLDAANATRIVDGSGLSKDNRTTAATLGRLLHAFDQDLLRGPLLYDSLARPGQAGTLRRRLKTQGLTERLHAKTGTLSSGGIYALAGYIDGRRGRPGYVFAILLNGVPGGRSLIDDLVREMAKR